VFLTIELKTVV